VTFFLACISFLQRSEPVTEPAPRKQQRKTATSSSFSLISLDFSSSWRLILTLLLFYSHSAQGSLDALRRLQPDTAAALRDGAWLSALPAEQLVPGDIIQLRVGDKVCAHAFP
jgi:magnesium-transporting ATPase (P-type)